MQSMSKNPTYEHGDAEQHLPQIQDARGVKTRGWGTIGLVVGVGALIVVVGAVVGGTSVLWGRTSASSGSDGSSSGLVPSANPTVPSSNPTKSPTATPSVAPVSAKPSTNPSTARPSRAPSTSSPSRSPSTRPSLTPSLSPSTARPSRQPSTSQPSQVPSTSPTTSKPSKSPVTSKPSLNPTTAKPSLSPSTSRPSLSPTTSKPSISPSTSRPSTSPTKQPTFQNCPQQTFSLTNLQAQYYCGPANIGSTILTISGVGPINPDKCLYMSSDGIRVPPTSSPGYVLFSFSSPVRLVSYSFVDAQYGAGDYDRIEEVYDENNAFVYSSEIYSGCRQNGGLGCQVNSFKPIRSLNIKTGQYTNRPSYLTGIRFTPVTC